ncbi:sulfatase [Natrialbaceae archaeon A-CW2]|uniref:sulfatase family protein n=1 Tax=Natronosalvus amylolyticus TaxID=2961994 RepID=UPI0020C9A401|nr:sulfatase [Natronosalvus amylolyticus]
MTETPAKILYIDVDSLRPDHLGCYGYDRDTAPVVDALARSGMRFTNYYATDAPCLPSRTALFSSRFGIHTGAINHGGITADARPLGEHRNFRNLDGWKSWMGALRQEGYYTASLSPFVQRHQAWTVAAGFNEIQDAVGTDERVGLWQPNADEILPYVDDWLDRHATRDRWFLHVNFWDPHTPYATPPEFGDPFADEPAPEWLTQDIIDEQRTHAGPHSARDTFHFSNRSPRFDEGNDLARVPVEFDIDSRDAFKTWVDGYDTGVRYMDYHLGLLLDRLKEEGVYDETLIIISADHGEGLGELNVYGDHHLADETTCNVPLIISGPGIESGVNDDFHYQIDLAPTVMELVGGEPGARWDGNSFAPACTTAVADRDVGREYLVLSQGAWACQRGVRWDDWLLLRTYHDGFKSILGDVMLFDLETDPHETTNLANERPEIVETGLSKLGQWHEKRMLEAARDQRGGNPKTPNGTTDPMWVDIANGGPYHTRGHLDSYAKHLRETGRKERAATLEHRHR